MTHEDKTSIFNLLFQKIKIKKNEKNNFCDYSNLHMLFCKGSIQQRHYHEPILKTDISSIGKKIIYPNFQQDEVIISKIT